MGLNYTTQLGVLDGVKNDLAYWVRRRIFDLFMRECAPASGAHVADFGVSGHAEHPAHYFFEALYPHRDRLTVVGRAAEDARWFPERFTGLTFLEADLRSIPLPDDYFEAGICNAVVEHAGTREQQLAVVREVCRVCRCVLFTTPNKSFPVELHTFLPFIHWLPDSKYRWLLRRLGHHYFADVENLNLLNRHQFAALFPPERSNRVWTTGLPVWPTNLVCVSRKRDHDPR